VRYGRNNAQYAFDYATFLFSQKKLAKGLEFMKKALQLNPKLIEPALSRMILSGVDKKQIEKAIPDDPDASISFARFLFKTGDIPEAVDRYIETLDLIENQSFSTSLNLKKQNDKKRQQFLQIYNFFAGYNDLKNAMYVLERAEKHLPMDAVIKVTLGDLYFKQDILYLARDKYDHALLLDPGNKHALQMLKKINL
jgi:tetratricopeptide (TPR) repeat protein